MKAEKFSESLNQISDRYIEEAASYQPLEKAGDPSAKNKTPRSLKVWRVIAIAACALLAVGIGVGVIGLSSGSSPTRQDAMPDQEYRFDIDYNAESYDTSTGGAAAEAYYADGEEYAETPAADSKSQASSMVPKSDSAKIIYTASMYIDTSRFDESMAKIEEVTNLHGGYFENLDVSNGSSSYRRAYYQIRIPAEEFDAFMKETEGFGTITSSSTNAADISDTYYDIESRLNTAKAKLARLQELLASAQDMSDIITIENEIANVQYEIDDLSGTLKSYDSEVAYSTVSITLDEVYKTSNEGTALTFGERLSNAFSGGLSSFGSFLEDFVVWLAQSWIWILIVLAVIAAAIIIPIKATQKARDKKKK